MASSDRGDDHTSEETAGSLAARALISGRQATSRSFRHHRPRGPFCGRGWCQQCPVAGDGLSLACRSPSSSRASRSFDPLRPLGLLAERLPPWFYEDRLLRPRWLRQPALRVLRRLAAAPRLPREHPAGLPPTRSTVDRELAVGTLVIGGGPAGLAAASERAAAGDDVLVLEAGGGGFPPVAVEVRRIRERLRHEGVRMVEGAACIAVEGGHRTAAVIWPGGPEVIHWDRLVVATGAYDRLLLYRGNDLPGTIGLRGLEAMATPGSLRGVRVGVVAGSAEVERARGAVERAGGTLAWEISPEGTTDPLLEVGGRGRIRWARLERSGRHRTELVLLAVSQPSFELQAQMGFRMSVGGFPPVIRSADPGGLPVIVVGEAAGWVDETAGAQTAVLAARELRTIEPPAETPGGAISIPHPDSYVCWCEDVRVRDITRAVDEGFTHVELVKRRTGATTGPCQGKLCLAPLLETVAAPGVEPGIPTVRPPVRPVALADLAGGGNG